MSHTPELIGRPADDRVAIRYRGKRPDRTAGTGASSESPTELTKRLFDNGWRELVVTRNGEVVGSIERSFGKRIWWAET